MSRFVHINELVNLPMLGNKDFLMRAKGRLLTWAKFVYNDMNLACIKKAKRIQFQINKRTNTVKMPCEFDQLSSVNVLDERGVEWPVYRNYRLHDDIVEIGAAKDCACEFKCGYQLCNIIKGYESVTSTQSDFLPNGNPISFTCISRKAVDRNGFFYIETQYPQRVYTNGVWTNTILYTDTKTLCKCEIDSNGCVCDTDENVNNVCNACGGADVLAGIPVGGSAQGPPQPGQTTWIYHCNSKLDWLSVQCGSHPHYKKECNNIYNINELGDTLIFPHDFGFDKVIVRFYYNVDLKNMEVPLVAAETFVFGLLTWDTQFDMKQQKVADNFERKYSQRKFGLLKELNKYRIAEMAQILVPRTRVPSYIDHRNDRNFEGGYY